MKKIILPVLLAASLLIACKSGAKSGFQVKLAYKNADKWISGQNAG
jgi:hypothetical protein